MKLCYLKYIVLFSLEMVCPSWSHAQEFMYMLHKEDPIEVHTDTTMIQIDETICEITIDDDWYKKARHNEIRFGIGY